MAKQDLFNANTQQVEKAEFEVDQNNEIVATFKDGTFVKFPAGLSKAEFTKLKARHQSDNEGKEVLTEEVLAAQDKDRLNSEKLIEG